MPRDDSSEQQTDHLESPQEREQKFFALFEQYQDAIFRFLFFRVGNRAVALDITQDTFTKTWVYMAGGKTIEHEEAFLYRTAKNALIDYFKKSKSSSLDALMEAGFDPGTNKAADDILKGDDIDTIHALVEDLDEENRQIIYLRFGEEKPIEEIAELFGKSTNAMTVHIHRLVKKLRGRFTDVQERGT